MDCDGSRKKTICQNTASMNQPIEKSRRNLPKELSEVLIEHLTDPTTVRDSIELLNHEVVHLTPEVFEVKRITVPLEDCCLIYTWSNAAARSRAKVHKDFDLYTVVGPHAGGSLNGAALNACALIASASGAQAEVIIDAGYEAIAWLVAPQVLDEHLKLRGTNREFSVPELPEIWHPAKDVARAHFELGVRIAEAAENAPQIFNDNHWARYGAQVEFMDSLITVIESCSSDDEADTDKKRRSYSEIVKKCEDFTSGLEGRRPYVSELCALAQVSERTLQYAFRDIMGMPPLTYLHRLRLHRARDELRAANHGSTTVTTVALNWGFWHFGEFSRTYKNCFGESPSNTLKQNFGA
jgi:AraC family ethanolamine operon transcriptional activator